MRGACNQAFPAKVFKSSQNFVFKPQGCKQTVIFYTFHFEWSTVVTRRTSRADIPVGVEIAGCLVEAQGCNQCGCPLGTSKAGRSYPGSQEKDVNHYWFGPLDVTIVTKVFRHISRW